MKKLTQKMVETKFRQLSGWMLNKSKTEISKTFTMPDFVHGLAFSARVAVHAEILGHHPTLEIEYGKVTITLTTHDLKGLSQADFTLAQKIDRL